jgi:hypothetical protein
VSRNSREEVLLSLTSIRLRHARERRREFDRIQPSAADFVCHWPFAVLETWREALISFLGLREVLR